MDAKGQDTTDIKKTRNRRDCPIPNSGLSKTDNNGVEKRFYTFLRKIWTTLLGKVNAKYNKDINLSSRCTVSKQTTSSHMLITTFYNH